MIYQNCRTAVSFYGNVYGIVVRDYIRVTVWSRMNRLASEENTVVAFKITEMYSYVADDVFAVFFMSVPTRPQMLTITEATDNVHRLHLMEDDSELAFVCQMF